MSNENETAELEKLANEKMEQLFSAADEKSMGMIEEYVAGEFCQTLAKLAVYLGKERAERALGKLPEETRAEIGRRIDELGDKTRTDPAIVIEATQVLEKTDFFGKTMADSVIDGAEQKVLAALSREIDTLSERNPVLAANINEYMFIFEDIVHLDDRATQRMLREVDSMTIAKALRGKNAKAVQKKIFQNMSRRAAAMLKDDIEFMGPVRVRDVDAAQKEVLDIFRRLEKNGDIVIFDRADEVV